MFTLNVGNFPPKAECVVSIKYATLLSTVGEALKLSIPITKLPMKDFQPSTRYSYLIFCVFYLFISYCGSRTNYFVGFQTVFQ